MRIEKTEIFTFDELNKEAKETALEGARETLQQDFHIESEMITEDFQYDLNELGYPTDVSWSLGHCQGDGVAFYGDIEDLDKVAKRLLDKDMYNIFDRWVNTEGLYLNFQIERNSFGHHYSHFNTMEVTVSHEDVERFLSFSLDFQDEDNIPDQVVNEIEDMITELHHSIQGDVKEVSKELEKQGYEQIDYALSDEGLEEMIKANDWEFTKEGHKW